MTTFLDTIIARRVQRFLPKTPGGIRTEEEALEYINQAGFCLFSYIPGVELPSLSEAASHDEGVDLWGWKDSLPAARLVYYGAVFHPEPRWEARPGFVSLEMLAPLYALAPILQFAGDRELMRRWVKISPEAITIADALENSGSLSTRELRAATGLNGKANATRFSRGLIEAQAHFLVTKVGVTSTTRGNYGYVWSTFERVFSEAARQAEALPETDAAAAILRKYVGTAAAVPLERIAAMLGLDARLLRPAAARLVEQGVLCEVEDEWTRYLVMK